MTQTIIQALREHPNKAEILSQLTEAEQLAILHDWPSWARPEQRTPRRAFDVWLILAGRGWGKTRTGAEWLREQIEQKGKRRAALVARTAADARDVMVNGESGLLAIFPPHLKPVYEPSNRKLIFPNGAIATTYSADEPDALRGPQHDCAWADEPAAWRRPDAWDQLMFGLRLGRSPQAVATTTPRPTPLIKELLADKTTAVTTGSTYDNAANLAGSFLQRLLRKFEGTRLGRQEIHAEVLTDTPGALWTHELIEKGRVKSARLEDMRRIVVAVDPNVTSKETSDDCGIVIVAESYSGDFYVWADRTRVHPTPDEWASTTAVAYYEFQADRVIGEVNNGGDLVEANLRNKDKDISYKAVRATRGKILRAEPIAALYEQGRVHHIGAFAELEDQMTTYSPINDTESPDRLDALVWGLTELSQRDDSEPNIR